MKRIECVIMDWAGTTVDYGCFAPVAAFVKAFNELGIEISIEEARGPMGMTKIDHIRELFRLPNISARFNTLFGHPWEEKDVVDMNARFEKHLFASLAQFTDPIPGVKEIIENLRGENIKIGSTTGYTAAMMDIVAPEAAKKGYTPDSCVTSNHLPAGRPSPYMIYQNMINLAVESPQCIVKVGDTIADIKEGINAGAWSVGVVLGSSELGLTQHEVATMDKEQLCQMIKSVRMKMLKAGAHYVIDTMQDLPAILAIINNKLNQ